MSLKIKSILVRLFKGFLAGAVTSMLAVTVTAPGSWADLTSIASLMAIAGLYGGSVGLLLAIEKWLNWKP
jgi:hypothetical protein